MGTPCIEKHNLFLKNCYLKRLDLKLSLQHLFANSCIFTLNVLLILSIFRRGVDKMI